MSRSKALCDFRPTRWPVSYTHLDVYKRQAVKKAAAKKTVKKAVKKAAKKVAKKVTKAKKAVKLSLIHI